MKGHYYKPRCKCPGLKKKKCKCGAKWAFMLDLGKKPDGSRNQKKRGGFDTKDDAEAAAAIMMEQFKTNSLPEDVALREAEEQLKLEEAEKEEERLNISFADLAEEWYENYKVTGKRKRFNTLRNKIDTKNRIVRCFDKPSREITHQEYQDTIIQLKEGTHEKYEKKKFTTQTLASTHTTAKMIFDFGVKQKYLDENPAKGAHIPTDYQTVEEIEFWEEIPEFLELEELIVFLDTAYLHGKPLDYEIFTMLAYTGIRIGELEALQEIAFNPLLNKIKIIKNYINHNNYKKFELGPPKTLSSIRELNIDPEITIMMLRLIAHHNILKESNSSHFDQGFIFGQTVGKYIGYPIPEAIINSRMKRILKIAELNEELSPHSLRHTFTSLMAEAGASLEQIMEMLGHAGDTMTKRVYLHTTKNKKKDAVEKYSGLLQNTINREQNVTQMLPKPT